MIKFAPFMTLTVALALGACAVAPPVGPSVMALPGKGKNLADFQQDEMFCQDYAVQGTGGKSPSQAATDSAVGSAAIGTALGAAAGAAIGSTAGEVGAGAAIGGAAGLLMGSAVGSSNARMSAAALQDRYDTRYIQCMTAKGNSVPVSSVVEVQPQVVYPQPYPEPYYVYPQPYPPPYYGGYYGYRRRW